MSLVLPSRIHMAVRAAWPPISLTLLALVAQFFPDWLQFDRSAIAAGQIWRLVAGHWTHWSWNHLLWSGGMFALLVALSPRLTAARLLARMIVWSIAISAAIWFFTGLPFYRGLSGIDSALFVLVAIHILRDTIATRQTATTIAVSSLLAGLGAKIIFEMATGRAIFVAPDASGMIPVPLAHLAGACVGMLAGVRSLRECSSTPPASMRYGSVNELCHT